LQLTGKRQPRRKARTPARHEPNGQRHLFDLVPRIRSAGLRPALWGTHVGLPRDGVSARRVGGGDGGPPPTWRLRFSWIRSAQDERKGLAAVTPAERARDDRPDLPRHHGLGQPLVIPDLRAAKGACRTPTPVCTRHGLVVWSVSIGQPSCSGNGPGSKSGAAGLSTVTRGSGQRCRENFAGSRPLPRSPPLAECVACR